MTSSTASRAKLLMPAWSWGKANGWPTFQSVLRNIVRFVCFFAIQSAWHSRKNFAPPLAEAKREAATGGPSRNFSNIELDGAGVIRHRRNLPRVRLPHSVARVFFP